MKTGPRPAQTDLQPQSWRIRFSNNPLPYVGGYTAVVIILLVCIGLLISHDSPPEPPLRIVGGGFMFNYRVSEVYMGVVIVPVNSVRVGDIIEASFENPAGGAALVVEQRIGLVHEPIQVRSPHLQGVVAGQSYRVVLRLLTRDENREIWTTTLYYKSNVDSVTVKDQPPVLGPGYHPNPLYDAGQ